MTVMPAALDTGSAATGADALDAGGWYPVPRAATGVGRDAESGVVVSAGVDVAAADVRGCKPTCRRYAFSIWSLRVSSSSGGIGDRFERPEPPPSEITDPSAF